MDQKTITVPWNYQERLERMNAMIVELTGDESKQKTFNGYIDEVWRECMSNTDKCLKTAQKPVRSEKKG